MALAVAIHGLWLLLTWHTNAMPWWIAAPAGAVILAWHSSLQHEPIHGHPTRTPWINNALASAPLSLWLPFPIYRTSHLAHHRDDRLTDPLDDPESWYWTVSSWQALSPIGRRLVRAQTTLAGRMLIGPFWSIGRFLFAEAKAIRNTAESRRIWARHILVSVPVLFWLGPVCGVDIGFYIGAMVLPSTSLLLIRSFAEHRAADLPAHRTAVVERSWLLGPLFLFNNLHAAHHAAPGIPWYRLPAWYRAHRTELAAANGGLIYRGYADVTRRFLLRPHDTPVSPLRR